MDLLFGSIDGGPFAVLFALGRSVSLIAQDALVLRAIGMTRHDLVRAAVGAHLVTAAAAAAAAASGLARTRRQKAGATVIQAMISDSPTVLTLGRAAASTLLWT